MTIDRIVSGGLLLMILVPLSARAQVPRRAWNFEQLLSPPTTTELQRVDQDWQQKSWTVEDITRVGVSAIPMGRDHFEARFYTHTLNGSRRCGVVVIPRGTPEESTLHPEAERLVHQSLSAVGQSPYDR